MFIVQVCMSFLFWFVLSYNTVVNPALVQQLIVSAKLCAVWLLQLVLCVLLLVVQLCVSICDHCMSQLVQPGWWSLQSPANGHDHVSDNEDCYVLVVFFIFFWPDFSTSLGRFLRNFATWCSMSWNSLPPIGVFICAPNKFERLKTPISDDFRTQNQHFEPRHSLMRGKSGNVKQ